jgi:predicted dehydrogenase
MNYGFWATTDLDEILLMMGCHPIDLALSFFGDPAEVRSTLYGTDQVVAVALTLTFGDGRWAQIALDASQPRVQERVEMSGRYDGLNALLIVDNVERLELHVESHSGVDLDNDLTRIRPIVQLDGIRVWRPDYGIPNMQQTRHFVQGYAGEVREFVDAIVERRTPTPSHSDIVRSMRVVDAIRRTPHGSSSIT